MTAARLEELAVWAETNSDWCGRHGMTDVNANLLDLARCARAWAKVEKMRGQVSLEHTTPCYFWHKDGRADYSIGPTAIEAVEAAEVKL